MSGTIFTILAAATMVVSWIFLFIPIFPGINIIWAAAVGWGIYKGFTLQTWIYLIIITLLMIAGVWVDNIFISGKARTSGASWWSIVVGNIAGLVGAILLPPLGGLLFIVVGVLIVEFIRHRDWRKALVTSKEMLFGFGWAILARYGIGLIMIILWVIWAF